MRLVISTLVFAMVSYSYAEQSVAPVTSQAPKASISKLPTKKKSKSESKLGASLGVKVTVPSQALYAQLPIPRGTGFLVHYVAPNGPAAKSGINKDDVLLSLDNQILINEDQLSTLLALRVPGQVSQLKVIHNGDIDTLNVTLGQKDAVTAVAGDPHSALLFSKMPHQTSSHSKRTVTVEDHNGLAVMVRRGGQPWLTIKGVNGNLLFDGAFESDDKMKEVPIEWRSRVSSMRKSLKLILRRPRILPPKR